MQRSAHAAQPTPYQPTLTRMQRSAHATQRPVNHHNLSGEESEAAGGQAGWLENDSADLLVSLSTKHPRNWG